MSKTKDNDASKKVDWKPNPKVTMEIQREIAWTPNDRVMMMKKDSQDNKDK